MGFDIFKDRGAIERVDNVWPFGRIETPQDDVVADPDAVRLQAAAARGISRFVLHLQDMGAGIDAATVASSAFRVTRNGVLLQAGVDYVYTYDPSLHEVILSGGDPLLVADDRLQGIVDRLAAIPHVRRLRIHSRLPIVLPERVTDDLVDLLAATRLAVTVVVHANHARELDDTVAAAVDRLRQSRAILLNQAVLLKGVNDSAPVLEALSERLLDLGVVPYYLHLLDRVRGTAHFEVDEATARRLHEELRDRLPGYAVPRLAREVPGAPAKLWIG
jgi:KamA family protein